MPTVDQLDTPRKYRQMLVDILTPPRERSADIVASVALCVAAGSLDEIDATTFGFFANAAGSNACAITAADNTLTSADNPWTSDDVGKLIDVQGAGTDGATLRSAIAAYTSPGSVELVNAAQTTVEASKTSVAGAAIWGNPWTDVVRDSTTGTPASGATFATNDDGVLLVDGTTDPRSLSARAAEVCNVLDFGADESGDEDSTDAFEAAIAYLSAFSFSEKRELRIPHGSYTLTRGLVLPSFVDLVGDGRWRTRLNFALDGDVCISMAGASTNDRRRCSLRRLRIDGTDCVNDTVGVELGWNQQQEPIFDEVTIYGGYAANGAGTGLATGVVISGPNWTASSNELGVEGCHSYGMLCDLGAGEAVNIFTFWGGRFEGNAARNIFLRFADDDIQSQQINFFGTTIQGCITPGEAAVFIDGGKVLFSGCYFEGGSSPNWADYEVSIAGGKVSFADCHWSWAKVACRIVDAEVSVSGQTTIWSSQSGFSLGGSASLTISGNAQYFAGGTPVVFDDTTSRLEVSRGGVRVLTASATLSTKDLGRTITNAGAKASVTATMANCPPGADIAFAQGYTSIRNSTYRWVASGSGTSEYYLELAAGGDPGFSDPSKLFDFATERTEGTLGALAANQWGYGDNDTLGFSTIYYRAAADPDSQSVDTILVTYPLVVAPTNNQRLPFPSNSPSDSMTTDAVPGTSMELVMGVGQWISRSKSGTWT